MPFWMKIWILCTSLIAIVFGSQDTINAQLINTKVTRRVDLTSHLPKITSTVTIENTGKSSVKSFLFVIDPFLVNNLAFISVETKAGDEKAKLPATQTSVAGHQDNHTFYRVDFPKGLDAEKQITVDIETVFTHSLRPYPSKITQAEKQLVEFKANAYFYSPYVTTQDSATVSCASTNIILYSKVQPVSSSDSTVTYGPYKDLKAFSREEMTIHYENNSPFLAVTYMERAIEVSHWGNIAIEETLDIRHTGAVLKGPFSRYDYQRNQDGVSAIKSLKTVLPASAKDVYYRDEIGNISTSNLRETDDSVELELRPRFPLFGGWKTHYYIGYNVPSYQYLYNKGDNYVLKMRFVDHVFDDQVIDDMRVKIILPEGAKNIHFTAPYDVEKQKDELHYTYLDTVGRPVVTATKKNLVEQHLQDFELHYTFPKIYMLQEPLLVIGAFFVLFLIAIVYVRLDFSITKDEANESRMRMAGLVEQIQSVQVRRSALYQSYEDAINKYKSSKDQTTFTNNRKKIDADHKQLTQQIAALLAKLKAEGSEAAEKVTELQRMDSQVREQVTLEMQYAEKLISRKLNKQAYLETEKAVESKKEELIQKMDSIMSSF